MKTVKELANALLEAAGKASRGEADTEQVSVLCQCADSLIRLAKLQLEMRDDVTNRISWLSDVAVGAALTEIKIAEPASSVPVPQRIQQIQAEIDRAQKELDNPKTGQTMRRILQDKIQGHMDKLKFLNKTGHKAAA